MKNLIDLVTLVHNDNECVILEVKKNVRMDLIKLGCFSGDEELLRVTKNSEYFGPITYTIFYADGHHFSYDSNTLVSEDLKRKKSLIYDTIHNDLHIVLTGENIASTNYIQTPEDFFKKQHIVKFIYLDDSVQVSIDDNFMFNEDRDTIAKKRIEKMFKLSKGSEYIANSGRTVRWYKTKVA